MTMGRVGKVLTVRQPYAAALVWGPKCVENRTKPAPGLRPGDWLAIHSARELYDMDERAWRWFHGLWPDAPRDEADPRMRKGVILGVARYVGTATDETLEKAMSTALAGELSEARRWFGGPYGWLFDVRVPLATPIPLRGQLGVFEAPPDVTSTLQQAVSRIGSLPPVPMVPPWL